MFRTKLFYILLIFLVSNLKISSSAKYPSFYNNINKFEQEKDCLEKFEMYIYHYNQNNREDTIYRFVNIMNSNLENSISISDNLKLLNKSYKFNLNEIGLEPAEIDIVGGLYFEIFQDSNYFWKIEIVFGESVNIELTSEVLKFSLGKKNTSIFNKYRKVINECLKQTDYCILQVQVDWKKYLEKLKNESPESYFEMKKKYDEIKKGHKKNNK